jgi:hypothetical protein
VDRKGGAEPVAVKKHARESRDPGGSTADDILRDWTPALAQEPRIRDEDARPSPQPPETELPTSADKVLIRFLVTCLNRTAKVTSPVASQAPG